MKIKPNLACFTICLAALVQTVLSEAQPVIKMAGGEFFTLFLKSDGSLWTVGYNDWGQLGDGTYNNTDQPQMIVASNVTALAAGAYQSLFLKRDGSLWGMGGDNWGQLGDGSTNSSVPSGPIVPEQIVVSNVTAIAAGGEHSLFLKNDGSLWVMGGNDSGQLGDGTYNNTNLPEMIVASNVTAIAAGGIHSLFIKSDGSLWAMGYNGNGQLGDGTYNNTNRPEMIVASNVTAIAAGSEYSLFLKSDGSLWSMGSNSRGQIGDAVMTYYSTNLPQMIVASNVTAIASGWEQTLFLKRDGSLWAMGDNAYGELGDGSPNNDNGYFMTNQPEQIVSGGVTAIAAGATHSLFLKSDGSLWGMGDDQYGDLGNGAYTFNLPQSIVAGPPGYNQIVVQLLNGGNVSLSYVGMAGTNYELDRSFSLSSPNWVPQATNPAGTGGALVFTNTPDRTTNNFWRIHSVP
jgi:alpha-tubulin suppressor-like RCC1 family protein